MPEPKTAPRKLAGMRARRERFRAEHRCIACGADLPPDDTRVRCIRCLSRAAEREREKRRREWRERAGERWPGYADRPYGTGGGAESLGDATRRYCLPLDAETLAAVDALKARAMRAAGHSLPFETSRIVRDALRGLAGIEAPTRVLSPGGIVVTLVFTADTATRRVINRHILRTERESVSAAVRDLLVYAAFGAGASGGEGAAGTAPPLPEGYSVTTIDGDAEVHEWFADEEPE